MNVNFSVCWRGDASFGSQTQTNQKSKFQTETDADLMNRIQREPKMLCYLQQSQ